MQKRLFAALFLLALIIPVAIAIGAPGDGPRTPMILSATVEGDLLTIRGADLTTGPELTPFVTLSGEPLEIRPGFSEYEVQARLPKVPQGSYLLTVASDRNAPQAGVFSVSLNKQGGPPVPTSHLPSALTVCASKRHMRVEQSRDRCKKNETFVILQTDSSSDVSDSDDSDSDSDDVDSDSDVDGDSDVDDDSDDVDSDGDSADSDDDSGKDNGRGNGNGGGNGNGNGNGNDSDSDSDD